MITLLDGYPDDVLAISATGQVTARDYEKVLIPEGEARLKRHPKIRFLYHIGEEFKGMSPTAMFMDARFGLAHMRQLGRSALVTDVPWIADGAKLFAPFFHMPFRVFSNAEFEAARTWVLSADADA